MMLPMNMFPPHKYQFQMLSDRRSWSARQKSVFKREPRIISLFNVY